MCIRDSSMKPQTTVLINREATKHDVDKWMEDLFARIQLCVMHPHIVIQRDGTTNEEETMFEELRTTEVPIGTEDHQLQSTSCRRWESRDVRWAVHTQL